MRETSASLLSGLRKTSQPSLYETCWERFIDQYTPLIYHWCRQSGLNHHETEEITQQLMCRLVRALKNYRYDEQQKFRSWLFVCTRNVIFRFWTDQAKRKSDPSTDLNQLGQGQSLVDFLNQTYDREFELEARRRVRNKIGERDWNVFLALTETAEDASDVAHKLKLTVANVYKIKSRVVAALKSEVSHLQQFGIQG